MFLDRRQILRVPYFLSPPSPLYPILPIPSPTQETPREKRKEDGGSRKEKVNFFELKIAYYKLAKKIINIIGVSIKQQSLLPFQ